MPVYASVSDLRGRYDGTIAESAEALIEMRLGEAQRLAEARAREIGWTLEGLIEASRTTQDDITDVVCGMVVRMLRNLSGVTSQSTGPFSVSVDQTVASGKLWLTRDDRSRLGLRRRVAGSVEMVDEALPCVLRPPDRC